MSAILIKCAAAVLTLGLLLSPTAAGAADPAGTLVATDPINDGGPLAPDFTAPYQDLVGVYIDETATTLSFTWEVVDYPDAPLYTPGTAHYYTEFALRAPGDTTDCTAAPAGCFSVRASVDATGAGTGVLRSNCTNTGGLVQCQTIPTAVVTVSANGATDRITAELLKSDLGNPVDGTILFEQVLFQGIGAYTGAVLISGAMGDLTDMCNFFYTLGGPNSDCVV